MKHVQFSRGRYVVRVTVPEDLRTIIGKRELVEPLGGDKKTAERTAHGVIAGFLARIEEAREARAASAPTLSSAAKAHYREELVLDDRERATPDHAAVANLNAASRPIYASRLRLVASGVITGEQAEALIGYAADALARKGLAPDLPHAELLKALAEVQLDTLAVAEARDKGTVVLPEPKSALLTVEEPPAPAAVTPKNGGKGGKTLSDVLDDFHRERTAGNRTLAEKTMAEHKVAIRMFEEFMGSAIPARSIKRSDMLAYKQALLQTPNRYSLRFPGLTLPRAIKANAKRKEPFPTLDPQTINMKWLSHLSTIFKWAANNGHMSDNPAAGIRVDEGTAGIIPPHPIGVELLDGRDTLVCEVADLIAEAFDGPATSVWELAEKIVNTVERGTA